MVPWIWSGISLNVIATLMLTFHFIRNNFKYMSLACGFLFVGIWIEKGLGLIVPGFIPGPWGKIVEYSPSWIEIIITIGVWAMGAFIFTVLTKVTIAIETGKLRLTKSELE